MSIPLNDNIKINAPKPSDPRYFAPDNTPWASIVAVEAGIPLTERYENLPVSIMGVEYWWKDGAWQLKTPHITKTLTEITSLIVSNGLQIGYTYNITDADVDLFGGNSIFLQAVATNRLNPSGVGLFYDPKFDHSDDHNGVWNNFMYPTMSSVVGTFTPNETVTANNGATATYLASGFLRFISGNWTSATSMTGGTSSATSNISGQITPSYAIGVKRVWGGKMWTNVNGNIGNSIDEFTLNSEWSVIAFNTTDYNLVADPIEYDVENDMIVYRKDKSGQEVRTTSTFFDSFGLTNPIKYLQWGNHYDFNTGKGNDLNVVNGLLNNLNSCGRFGNFTLGQSAQAYGFTLGQYAQAFNFTLGQFAQAYGFTLGQYAGTTNFTLGQYAQAFNFTLEQYAQAYGFTLGQGAGTTNFTLGQSAQAYGFTLGQYAQAFNFTLEQYAQAFNFTLGQNTSLNMSLTGVITQNIQNTIIESGIYNVDLSAATFFYGSYAKTIRARQDGQGVLTYWNNSNNLVIANITD